MISSSMDIKSEPSTLRPGAMPMEIQTGAANARFSAFSRRRA